MDSESQVHKADCIITGGFSTGKVGVSIPHVLQGSLNFNINTSADKGFPISYSIKKIIIPAILMCQGYSNKASQTGSFDNISSFSQFWRQEEA